MKKNRVAFEDSNMW